MLFEERKKKCIEISLVPLINVVFLLLIFFLVAGSIREPDTLPVNIPISETAYQFNSTFITILFTKNGDIFFNNNKISEEELDSNLRVVLQDHPEEMITVNADAELPALMLMRLMRKITDAGGTEISIITEPKQ